MDQISRDLHRQVRRKSTALLFGVLLIASTLIEAQGPSEYQVKAAFVLNFTKFIEWPATAFENPGSPLTICIFGDDPFGREMDQLLAEEVVNGRKLAVQRLQRSAPNPKACQVLFVSKSEKDISGILSGLGPGVLTVSDRERFLMDGGMIALVMQDQHVRFDVNQGAAVRAMLMMNARMLNVARFVQK